MKTVVPSEIIEKKIFLLRGQKVMLDFHLAELYDVPTKSLNLAVKRNMNRFPGDFMFQLTRDETEELQESILRFQIETSKEKRGGRRYLPFAFTEQGVAMLSSVLRSERAVIMNIAVMRAFVQLREMLGSQKELARKLEELEKRIEQHDSDIHSIFEAIRQLMAPVEKPKRQIGFRIKD